MSEITTDAVPEVIPSVSDPWRSPEINELCIALAKCQKKIKPPKKSRTANVVSKKGESASFTYQYADLSDVLESINTCGPEYGLSHCQVLKPNAEGRMCIFTILMHESGQYIMSEYRLPPADNNHEMGGNITYGRRYTVAPLYGLAAEEDIDYKGDYNKGKTDDLKPPAFDGDDKYPVKGADEEQQAKIDRLHKEAVAKREKAEKEAEEAWAAQQKAESRQKKSRSKLKPVGKTEPENKPEPEDKPEPKSKSELAEVTLPEEYDGIDERLAEKLKSYENVALNSTVESFHQFVVAKGIFPETTKVKDYPADFVDHALAQWESKIEKDYLKILSPF